MFKVSLFYCLRNLGPTTKKINIMNIYTHTIKSKLQVNSPLRYEETTCMVNPQKKNPKSLLQIIKYSGM